MSFAESILGVALCVTTFLGFAVLLTRPSRAANQHFLVLSLTVSGWLCCVLLAFRSTSASQAVFWILGASLSGAFLPAAFAGLVLSIQKPELDVYGRLVALRWWLLAYLGIGLYCFSPGYLTGAELPAQGVPNAQYGAWSFLYPFHLVGGIALVFVLALVTQRRMSGVARAELQFVILGIGTFIGASVFAAVLPLFTHNSQIVSLSPLWAVAMDGVIAFGIATQRIMSVGILFRRVASYGLLAAYLAAVYAATFWCVGTALRWLAIGPGRVPEFVSAIVLAVTLGRARSVLQSFIRRLFITVQSIDLRDSLRAADRFVEQVSTTVDLIERFENTLATSVGAELVKVHLLRTSSPESSAIPLGRVEMAAADPLSQVLMESRVPFTCHAQHRQRTSLLRLEAARQLTGLGGTLALGIYKKGELQGVVILGEKLTGRIYDSEQIDTLQLLVNRFAVALENSRLYSRLQTSKIYLETLLDQLTSGVVAVDADGVITFCNTEAGRILSVGIKHR